MVYFDMLLKTFKKVMRRFIKHKLQIICEMIIFELQDN